jgi:hypothetical protein
LRVIPIEHCFGGEGSRRTARVTLGRTLLIFIPGLFSTIVHISHFPPIKHWFWQVKCGKLIAKPLNNFKNSPRPKLPLQVPPHSNNQSSSAMKQIFRIIANTLLLRFAKNF